MNQKSKMILVVIIFVFTIPIILLSFPYFIFENTIPYLEIVVKFLGLTAVILELIYFTNKKDLFFSLTIVVFVLFLFLSKALWFPVLQEVIKYYL